MGKGASFISDGKTRRAKENAPEGAGLSEKTGAAEEYAEAGETGNLQKGEQAEQGPENGAGEEVRRVVQACGKAEPAEKSTGDQHENAAEKTITEQDDADDERRSDVAAGEGLPLFFLVEDRLNILPFIRATAVDEFPEQGDADQAEQRNGQNPQGVGAFRIAEQAQQAEQRVCDKNRRRQGVIADFQRFFCGGVRAVKRRLFFIDFFIQIVNHRIEKNAGKAAESLPPNGWRNAQTENLQNAGTGRRSGQKETPVSEKTLRLGKAGKKV